MEVKCKEMKSNQNKIDLPVVLTSRKTIFASINSESSSSSSTSSVNIGSGLLFFGGLMLK